MTIITKPHSDDSKSRIEDFLPSPKLKALTGRIRVSLLDYGSLSTESTFEKFEVARLQHKIGASLYRLHLLFKWAGICFSDLEINFLRFDKIIWLYLEMSGK